MSFFRHILRSRSRLLSIAFLVGLAVLVVYARSAWIPRTARTADEGTATPAVSQIYLPYTPNAPVVPGLPTVPADIGAVPTIAPIESPTPEDTPNPTPTAEGTPAVLPYRVYLPVVGGGGAPTATPVPVAPSPSPTPVPAQAASQPPPTGIPSPTRAPIRITKLGLGVYDSGGAMLPDLDQARPSVILLQDPSVDFAKEVRQHFPKAFIIGRIFVANQPLDNPAQRGHDFADRVAQSAVPLKGVVDAWMSYNEVGSSDDPAGLANYGIFQAAFAHHLQDDYGIPAVAANDGPRAVKAQDYVKYYADAIRTSKYFGFHLYPNQDITSLRDPRAADQVFYYRQIHDALVQAGISHGPFIATEAGLYNGWRGVESDTAMGQDYTWLADQMNADPYVLGECVYGLFLPNRWQNFNIDGSSIPGILGDYNTVH